MHEHVETDGFLPLYRAGGLVLQIDLVDFIRQGAAGVRGARFPDFGRLRERADGRGREGGQVEALVLNADTISEYAGAATHGVIDAGDARRDLRVVNPRRGLARGGRVVRDTQGGFDAAASTGQCRPERGQFLELLHRERQPAFDFGIEFRFQRQIDRDMQQRAGGGDLHTLLAEFRDHGFELAENPAQVRAPDVAAVDDSERQHAVFWKIGEAVDLFRRAYQIEMQAGDRQRQRGIAIAAQPAKIGREHDFELRHRFGDLRIGVMQRLLPDDIEVEHETWLVDLHPFGAAVGQFAQHLDVNRQQPVEQR